jgi:hypothetical protein
MTNETKKVGRPSTYSRSIAEEICNTIATSSKGVKCLCKENAHWPCHDTIYRWLIEYSEFSDLYAQAKKYQVEVLVDEIIELADDVSHDEMINDHGKIVPNKEHINRSRLRIDSRKWIASKLVPRIYANKDQGECPECASRKEYANLSDAELVSRMEEILQSTR